MSTKSGEYLFGMTIRMSAERAKQARKEADPARVRGVELSDARI
jgi:hypothetical protein